jgi:hypothetical protein
VEKTVKTDEAAHCAEVHADLALPPHAFVPGGPWPHPNRQVNPAAPTQTESQPPFLLENDWRDSREFHRGIRLFNAGYYWEAHEAWEALWHAAGRTGPTADLLKALIKLAAAGLKVRQRQPHGVKVHAERAATLLQAVRHQVGPHYLGLDLQLWERRAWAIVAEPPVDPEPPGTPVSRVFDFQLVPEAQTA